MSFPDMFCLTTVHFRDKEVRDTLDLAQFSKWLNVLFAFAPDTVFEQVMSTGLRLTVIIGVYFRIVFCSSVKRQLQIPKCCPAGEHFNDSLSCVTSNSILEDWAWIVNSSILLNHEATVSTFSPTILANTSLNCPSPSR
jgi:hypothetical protein